MELSNEEMGAPHPDLIGLAAFVDGRLSEAERRTCVSHLAQCAECRAIVAAYARGAVPDNGSGVSSAPLPARSRFWGVPAWLPIAATLMLATTAAIMWVRTDSRVTPVTAPTTLPSAPAPATPEPTSPSTLPASGSPSTTAPSTPAAPESLGPRRGGERSVSGKTFRLVAGEWIDTSYDPLSLLKVETVEGAEARTAIIARIPALKEFAALGPRVTVVLDGIVYRFR